MPTASSPAALPAAEPFRAPASVPLRRIESIPVEWDSAAACRAFDMHYDEMRHAFRDGRLTAMFCRNKIRRAIEARYGDKLNPYQLRIVTKRGTAFSPAYMRGASREFDRERFAAHLVDTQAFAVFDVSHFPAGRVFIVPSQIVREWWQTEALRPNGCVSRSALSRLIKRG